MQNLSQLHHFQLVAQEQSFARAAELANITQPALSNSIRSLERRLGLTLFERSERPITLTPAARNILAKVDAVLFEARNLDKLLMNLASGQSGHIRLGMTAVFSTSLGGPIVARWHEQHPNVKLDLIVQETTDLRLNLRNENFDVIVGDARDLREDVEDFEQIELPPHAGGTFCRAGHPILDIPQPQVSDLARYRLVGTHFPAALMRTLQARLGEHRQANEPIIAVDSHNIAALRDAVAQSELLLLTTASAVRNELALGILQPIPIDLGIKGTWAVVTRRGRVLHPAAEHLIRTVVEVANRETHW